MKTIDINKVSKDELFTLEELILSCEELGGFEIRRVTENENNTEFWTFNPIGFEKTSGNGNEEQKTFQNGKTEFKI